MNKKSLILVGGGGHCKSVIDVALEAGYDILGVLDTPDKVGQRILDFEIIGVDSDIPNYVNQTEFVVSVGFIKDPSLRIKLHNYISSVGGKLATIVSPVAHVSRFAEIGKGSVVMHQAVVNAGARVGEGCIINTFANIEHDVNIGSNCHISTGVMINGDCVVGANTFVGSQSVLSNGITVPPNSVISAGSFVHKSQIVEGIYFGNPARLIKENR